MFGCFVFYFKGIINGFAKEDGLAHTQDNNREELRTDAEQNVSRFIEVAKQLETFFLQRRMQLSVLKPELLVKEVFFRKIFSLLKQIKFLHFCVIFY